jgi:hypothetical protein
MFPEPASHRHRPVPGRTGWVVASLFAMLLSACAAPASVPVPMATPATTEPAVPAPPPPAAAPAPVASVVDSATAAPPAVVPPARAAEGAPVVTPIPVIVAPMVASGSPVDALLVYADRLRAMSPADLAQEINNQADTGDSALRQLRLAMALQTSRTPTNSIRAQALLQRVLAQTNAQAQALHPLARLLAAQNAENRRQDEQIERQNQQLREAQRRIEQLNERLEAVRAIERSLRPAPVPPPVAPPAPAPPNNGRP